MALRFFRCLPGKTFDGLFHRCDRSLLARSRFARIERKSNKNVNIRYGGERETGRIVFHAERKRAMTTLLRPLPLRRRKSFCEIFLYPTQVTLSVSKKKLRYTTCKCILNVTVKCPYSKAPPNPCYL